MTSLRKNRITMSSYIYFPIPLHHL